MDQKKAAPLCTLPVLELKEHALLFQAGRDISRRNAWKARYVRIWRSERPCAWCGTGSLEKPLLPLNLRRCAKLGEKDVALFVQIGRLLNSSH